jgi:hypothetical protein
LAANSEVNCGLLGSLEGTRINSMQLHYIPSAKLPFMRIVPRELRTLAFVEKFVFA